MRAPHQTSTAAGDIPRRLFFYNAGFLRQPRLRRILHLAGHDLRLGLPSAGDGVVVVARLRFYQFDQFHHDVAIYSIH